MALGCAFIFVVILMLWRRHARKRRAKATAMFAAAKNLDKRGGWRWRLIRFGERLFGHKRSRLAYPPEQEQMRLEKLRADEEAQYERDMDKFLDSYNHSRAGTSRAPSPLPSLHDYQRDKQQQDKLMLHASATTLLPGGRDEAILQVCGTTMLIPACA